MPSSRSLLARPFFPFSFLAARLSTLMLLTFSLFVFLLTNVFFFFSCCSFFWEFASKFGFCFLLLLFFFPPFLCAFSACVTVMKDAAWATAARITRRERKKKKEKEKTVRWRGWANALYGYVLAFAKRSCWLISAFFFFLKLLLSFFFFNCTRRCGKGRLQRFSGRVCVLVFAWSGGEFLVPFPSVIWSGWLPFFLFSFFFFLFFVSTMWHCFSFLLLFYRASAVDTFFSTKYMP